MDKDQRREALEAFFDCLQPVLKGDLNEALYALDESGGWPDYVDSVSPEQALLCWRVVERLRREEFPSELRM